MQLTHVRLLVGDYAGCFAFYRDVLGLEPVFGNESSGYADFRAGEASVLAVFDRAEQRGVVELRPAGDGAVVVFGSDDVDAFAARARVATLGPPRSNPEWGIRFVHLRDPDGNLIEVNQPIAMAE